MPGDLTPLGTLGQLTRINFATSAYAAAALTVGGIAAIAAHFAGAWAWQWFVFGCCIGVGPQYLLFSSKWVMRARLAAMKEWRKADLISREEYDRLHRDCIA